MKTITIQNFHGGMADDIYGASIGEFSVAKHFDTLTYPKRLKPFRGMVSDTADTGIGNIIVASDGLMYGAGTDPNNAGFGKLWQRSGYGGSDVWQSIPVTNQLSGAFMRLNDYNLLVEYKDVGNAKTIFWASTNLVMNSDPAGASSATSQSLSFTHIGQGFVHPKDKILYIPYDNKIATVDGSISADINPAVWSLPSYYQIPCLTNYGNYLAIPAFATSGASVSSSIVYLSDRDTSLTTFSESINWGAGQLKVLNNLNGVLIGVSTASANYSGSVQDSDSLLIKVYAGGTEAVLVHEIKANHLPSSNHPSVTINPRVNFIYKNRMYFSADIVPNDGVSNSYYGLWSIGKNLVNGRYSVNLERMATNDNSELGVLAAAISGDFLSIAHTAEGTLTCTINGQTSSTSFAAMSVYESTVNPGMSENDAILDKSLIAVGIATLPLTAGQQVIMKYRIDSTAPFTPLFTKTSATPDTDVSGFEMSIANSASASNRGRNIEFRLESMGGAEIISFSYKYDILKSNLK